jgi:hypothetical protein
MSALRAVGQGLAWLALLAPVIILAQWPRHSPLPTGHGELKLSLAHTTERLQPCRQLGAIELQALPPNMRNVEQCERGRAPARLRLELDDRLLLDARVDPAGLHSDGRAYLQRRWSLPAGRYALRLVLRDSPREKDAGREQRFDLLLAPGDSVLLQVGDGEVRLISPLDTAARRQPNEVQFDRQFATQPASEDQPSQDDTRTGEIEDPS